METTRSLKECVGLAVSFLTQISRRPRRAARRSARTSGVKPVCTAARGACWSGREAVGAHEGREAGVQGGARDLLERQEVRVAPQVQRARLDAALQLVGVGR